MKTCFTAPSSSTNPKHEMEGHMIGRATLSAGWISCAGGGHVGRPPGRLGNLLSPDRGRHFVC